MTQTITQAQACEHPAAWQDGYQAGYDHAIWPCDDCADCACQDQAICDCWTAGWQDGQAQAQAYQAADRQASIHQDTTARWWWIGIDRTAGAQDADGPFADQAQARQSAIRAGYMTR